MSYPLSYLWGFLGLFCTWLLYKVFSKWRSLGDLVKGENGIPSAAMFQFLLWTGVIIFSYITIYAASAYKGDVSSVPTVSGNLLVLMGISTGSMVISKGITDYKASRGTAVRTLENKKKGKLTGGFFQYLICDVDGPLDKPNFQPALNKLQMIVWTFIAIAIFLVQVVYAVQKNIAALPKVDDSMLILMGISQTAYLGKKLVSNTMPMISSISKGIAKDGDKTIKGGDEILVTGDNLGDEQGCNIVRITTLNDSKKSEYYPSEIKEWSHNSIKFILPIGLKPQLYNVSLTFGDKHTNPLTFQVEGG